MGSFVRAENHGAANRIAPVALLNHFHFLESSWRGKRVGNVFHVILIAFQVFPVEKFQPVPFKPLDANSSISARVGFIVYFGPVWRHRT